MRQHSYLKTLNNKYQTVGELKNLTTNTASKIKKTQPINQNK